MLPLRSRAKPGKAAPLRGLLILLSEVARNAVEEVRWRRRRERTSGYVTSLIN